MTNTLKNLPLLTMLVLGFLFPSSSIAKADVFESDDQHPFALHVRPLLKKFCADCHGNKTAIEGDADLAALDSDNLDDNLELISQMIDAVELEEMPPADAPALKPELRSALVKKLKSIRHSLVSKHPATARTPIRRLNRFQYNNAVIDLFQLNCIVFTLPERMMREHKRYFKPDTGKMASVVAVGSRPLGKSQMIEPRLAGVAAFPQDLRAEHGFDNQADHLSLSPLLMESFLKLGQSITGSKDFTPRNVGIWKSFFAAPTDNVLHDPPSLETELNRRLHPFLTKAFRRPVSSAVLNRYIKFAVNRIETGEPFPVVMKTVAAATIASPKFLYLYNVPTDSPDANTLADFELASRLSFFLWGSLPDEELLHLAAAGKLKQLKILNQQIDRMLGDRKLKRFCDSFPTQWLQLDRIISSTPNPEIFPTFYFSKYRNSMHMMLEPLLLFETVLIENRPITELIDPEFTYRSKRLDSAYGELNANVDKKSKGGAVTVLNFHRVPVNDRRTGGVITNAAVMTMTSGTEQSKPITRGAWIASVIFNNPPEPPPADVPPLDEKPSAEEAHLTLRERLDMHRARSDCRGCHEKIDPLGFALENFDAVGRWRNKYENGRKIDMMGRLFRKHAFATVPEFKDAILSEKDRFTRGLAGHLLSYALARKLSASDQIALDNIAQATSDDDYRFKTLIKQVILSDPFLPQPNPLAPELNSGK